jgi:NET1-associated nuclear protein 1 (U3 small nucleolar RNA-associated protein 17)
VIEPRNHHVVLNGIPGNIQFYDANADSHVMDLEVVPMNRISRAGEKEMVEPHVDHVAFLRTGEWMATVDKRDDQVTTPELFLKFWRWDPDAQAYKLHTRVDYPHTKPITSILFNPNTRQGPMAITTSLDKTFKVWGLNAGRKDGEDAWMCRSVGVYRDDVPSTASFSEDGGILAVGFGQLITLWDPYLNSIQGVLAQPQSEVIETVHFFGDGHPFLIAKTKKHLYVWNILTCKVSWCYKMLLDHLVVDTASGQFVVVTNTNTDSSRLVVFDVKSPIPTAIHYLDYKCLSIAWLPKEQEDETGFSSSSSLLTFTSKHDLVVYNIKSSQQKKQQQTKNKISNVSLAEASSESSSMLDGIYGKRLAERETDEQQRLRLQTAQSMRDEAMANTRKEVKGRHRLDGDGSVLSAPSHVLPSVDSVFDTFMSSIMSLRIVEEANDIEQEAMDVDQDDSINQNEQIEQTEVDVVNRANVDLPSLSTYFQQQLSRLHLYIKCSLYTNFIY